MTSVCNVSLSRGTMEIEVKEMQFLYGRARV